MRLHWYHYFELLGTVVLVVSTAFQLFVLDPTLRKNDQDDLAWKLTQTVQNTRVAASLDSMVILEAMHANAMDVSQQLSDMKTQILASKKRIRDASLSNLQQSKSLGLDEKSKRYITLAAFLFGSLLLAFGRFGHLRHQR